MSWKPYLNSGLGVTAVGQAILDTAPTMPIGARVDMIETTQGPGKLIYLPGVASLVAGDVVYYDLTPAAQTVTRAVDNTANNSGRPVAIAVDAPPAGSYGWFQVEGCALANVVAGTVAGKAMLTATAGQMGNTADAGDQVENATILSSIGTPDAGQAYVLIQSPFIQGQIT